MPLFNSLHGRVPGQGFLGRSNTGNGAAELLSPSQATDLLPAATASNDGKMTAAQAGKLAQFSTESEYVRLGGRAGGQIEYGGTQSGEDLSLYSNLSKDGLIKLGDNSSYSEGSRKLLINNNDLEATISGRGINSDVSGSVIELENSILDTILHGRNDGNIAIGKRVDTTANLVDIDKNFNDSLSHSLLKVGSEITQTGGYQFINGVESRVKVNGSGFNPYLRSLFFQARGEGTANNQHITGIQGEAALTAPGTTGSSLNGATFAAQNSSGSSSQINCLNLSAIVQDSAIAVKGLNIFQNFYDNPVTDNYGVYIHQTGGGGTTNTYGLYINSLDGTNKWAIYDNSGADSYLSGTLTIGTHMYLNSPMYRDLQFSVNSLSSGTASNPDIGVLNSTLIDVALFDGGVATEEVSGVLEIDHDYDEGTDIIPHIHWYPTDANTGNVKWQLEYVIVDVSGSGVVTGSTTISVTTAATGTAWQLVTSNFQAISGSSIEIGDQIHFKLFRDPSDAADTYSSDVAAATLGFHYLANSLGSSGILVK